MHLTSEIVAAEPRLKCYANAISLVAEAVDRLALLYKAHGSSGHKVLPDFDTYEDRVRAVAVLLIEGEHEAAEIEAERPLEPRGGVPPSVST